MEQDFSLYDLLNVLRRRRNLIFITIFGILFFVFLFNEMSAPVYEAKTTIEMEKEKEPFAIGDFDYLGISSNTYIKNRIEEIKSRTLSEEVVSSLPWDVLSKFNVPKSYTDNTKKIKYIANIIRGGITAEPIRESDIINIKVQNENPLVAMTVANTMVDVLKNRQVKFKREEIGAIREFIEEQLKTFKDQLMIAEGALRNFKQADRVTYLNMETTEILRRMTEAEVLYNAAKSDRGATERRQGYIDTTLSMEKCKLPSSITNITSPWSEKLKEKLLELEVQYTTLTVQGYPDDHPQITKLKEQIAQTKQNLIKEILKVVKGETIIDPISRIHDLMTEKIAIEIELETHKAKEDILKGIVDTYDKKLQSLPEKEFKLAQLTRASEVNDKIYRTLLEKYEEARITEAGKTSNIRTLDTAELPKSPIKPKKKSNLALGLIVGIVLSIGLAFGLEALDKSIKTVEDVEKVLPVIGSVPSIKREGKRKTIVWLKGTQTNKEKEGRIRLLTNLPARSHAVESYRGIRTNIGFASPDKPLKMVLITSACPSEGKSLTTANLAIIMAQTNMKTLVIDADLRKPQVAYLFDKPREPGVTDVLAGSAELKDVIIPTVIDNLWIIPAGTIPPDPTTLLSSQKTKDLLNKLRKDFDFILIDTPPIVSVTDALILSPEVDGVILVARSEKTGKDTILKAFKLLNNRNTKVLGAVINDVDVEHVYGRYGYYSHYYDYYTDESTKKHHKKKIRI
ncbi:MAG: polysaccharide biosynthesis tyrosine autokinase [bacterium]|nr:polysaccharide biosynthesis tyrosine autokinase [bacterium]